MALWNATYVGLFYTWLYRTDHWTWAHTWLICASMLVLRGLALAAGRAREPAAGERLVSVRAGSAVKCSCAPPRTWERSGMREIDAGRKGRG